MKTPRPSRLNDRIIQFRHLIIALGLLLLSMAGASAQSPQNLYWDPGDASGTPVVPASGAWDTTTANWYNGTANVGWTQTSTTSSTNAAIFNGPNGSYNVTLDSGQIAFSNLFVYASGYT